MTSVDEHLESIRARGEDRESHGCARHAPAGCAEHDRQLGGESPLPNRMEVKG